MSHAATCFVDMPVGKKMDLTSGTEIDLDHVYQAAIKPAIEEVGLDPIRGDEEQTGGIIDEAMFARLLLLGYQFCPRLADMGDARFWRIDTNADYGPLNDLARNRVHVETAYRNWDDALRLAGSLKLGHLQPDNLMRTLQKGDRMTELQKALMVMGRINETIYMLNYMDDPIFRRRILAQRLRTSEVVLSPTERPIGC